MKMKSCLALVISIIVITEATFTSLFILTFPSTMAIPLNAFMQDLLFHNVGGVVSCAEVAIVVDNAANHEEKLRSFYFTLMQNSVSPSQTLKCLDLPDHSKRLSRWGEPSPARALSCRFDSSMPFTSNPEVPPVAPPRMMSPEISGSRKKILDTAIVDISSSKEASLRKYTEHYFANRNNDHKPRQDKPARKDLASTVERALQICDTRPL
jgi:hypothetical protein